MGQAAGWAPPEEGAAAAAAADGGDGCCGDGACAPNEDRECCPEDCATSDYGAKPRPVKVAPEA